MLRMDGAVKPQMDAGSRAVAQTFRSAVSPTFQSAGLGESHVAQTGQAARRLENLRNGRLENLRYEQERPGESALRVLGPAGATQPNPSPCSSESSVSYRGGAKKTFRLPHRRVKVAGV